MHKDLISIKDLSGQDLHAIFSLTDTLKHEPQKFAHRLQGKTLALVFEKPSNRTYVSFQVGMYQLGGNSIYLGPEHIKLGVRETIHDAARTLSRYVDAIVLRTFAHQVVLDMAKYAEVPVINGLSDLLHPCQGLTDIYTIKERLGRTKGVTLAYIGDGNNVCHSLLHGCAKTGVNLHVATPKGYEPDAKIVQESLHFARSTGAKIKLFHDPKKAALGADVLYTDVWASMGQEKEAEKRKKTFKEFQINKKLLEATGKRTMIMHCLPAHREEEITGEAIDSANSIVFDQAENRLHVQKAVLITLMRDKAL